jgi:hypothetical protein
MPTYASAWEWKPEPAAWYKNLEQALIRWCPAAELRLDRDLIVESVIPAVLSGESWLFHPCISALTWPRDLRHASRDLQFAAWVAAHVNLPPTSVELNSQVWIWAPSGGQSLPQGTCDVRMLGEQIAQDPWPCRIAIDVWCESAKVFPRHSWATSELTNDERTLDLPEAICSFVETLAVGTQCFPDSIEWLASVTKIAVPLRGSASHSRSASYEKVPGLVDLTFGDDLHTLEALVHESAHQHLFIAKAGAPLADPKDSTTYKSPLRPDPRPLGAVLTAYHAIMYMGTLYSEASRVKLLWHRRADARLEVLRADLADAERILDSNRSRLTEMGRSVLDTTMDLAGRVTARAAVTC